MTSASVLLRPTIALPRVRQIAHRVATRTLVLELSSATLLCAVYVLYSLRSHWLNLTNGFDLGIFTQGVRGWSEGTGPISSLKGAHFNLLGDHFSPVTALIAPFYALFPTPWTLLIAQSVLVAVSAIPICTLFKSWFGGRVALMAVFSYGLSFGVAQAVGFDFHEVAFAAPLLAFAMVAMARGRAVATAAWTAPLVLVKEDLGVTVAAVGVVLFLVTKRKLPSLFLILFGPLSSAFVIYKFIPHFNPDHRYAYSSLVGGPATEIQLFLAGLDVKVITMLCLLGVGGFIATRSPLLLVAVPTVLWRFTSGNPNYWGMVYHYGLLLMPIVFVAMADGIRRLHLTGVVTRSVARTFVAVSLGVSLLILPTTPLFTLWKPEAWRISSHEAAVQQAQTMIPEGVTVAASGRIVPHLVSKDDVWLFWSANAIERNPDWIIVDTIDTGSVIDSVNPAAFIVPNNQDDANKVVDQAIESGWHRVFTDEGVVVLKRNAPLARHKGYERFSA